MPEAKFVGPRSSVQHPPLADRLLDILIEVVLGVEPPKNEPADHVAYRAACVRDVAAIRAAGHIVVFE